MPAIRTTRNSTAGSAGPSQDPSRPPRAAGAEHAPKEDATYNTGDFTIIAGSPDDRVIFRLPSFFMLAASVVMRDTFAIGTAGGKLELDVPNSAHIVKLWLDVITGRTLPPPDDTVIGRMGRVLALCQKFDCISATSIIMAYLETAIDVKDVAAIKLLRITAQNGGNRQFVKSIGARGNKKWAKTDPTLNDPNSLEGLVTDGATIRDPASWSLKNFSNLPSAFAWALLRSYRLTDTLPQQTERLTALLAAIDNRSRAKAAGESASDSDSEDEP